MKTGLFIGGLFIATGGALAPAILPQLPSSVQLAAQGPAVWLINNGQWVVIAGLVLILVSVFL